MKAPRYRALLSDKEGGGGQTKYSVSFVLAYFLAKH